MQKAFYAASLAAIWAIGCSGDNSENYPSSPPGLSWGQGFYFVAANLGYSCWSVMNSKGNVECQEGTTSPGGAIPSAHYVVARRVPPDEHSGIVLIIDRYGQSVVVRNPAGDCVNTLNFYELQLFDAVSRRLIPLVPGESDDKTCGFRVPMAYSTQDYTIDQHLVVLGAR